MILSQYRNPPYRTPAPQNSASKATPPPGHSPKRKRSEAAMPGLRVDVQTSLSSSVEPESNSPRTKVAERLRDLDIRPNHDRQIPRPKPSPHKRLKSRPTRQLEIDDIFERLPFSQVSVQTADEESDSETGMRSPPIFGSPMALPRGSPASLRGSETRETLAVAPQRISRLDFAELKGRVDIQETSDQGAPGHSTPTMVPVRPQALKRARDSSPGDIQMEQTAPSSSFLTSASPRHPTEGKAGPSICPARLSSGSLILDQAALTWQEDEITGHLIDDTSPDDDGEGINGIGFRPTPALAYARSQKRRQQLNEWKAREAREARQRRFEKRRGAGGSGELDGKRVVRFQGGDGE